VAEIVFWWAVRAALLYCGVINRGEAVFYFIVFVLTFAVDIIRLIFPKCGISYRMQTFICFLSSVSTVAAIGLGVLEKNPDFDLAVQLAGGIFSGAAGYYIAMALRKPGVKNECLFVTFFTFCFSANGFNSSGLTFFLLFILICRAINPAVCAHSKFPLPCTIQSNSRKVKGSGFIPRIPAY
jgi:hypothetical protein